MFKKIAIASAAASLIGIGQGAWAGQTSNTMNVTATVNKNCLVATGPSDFTGTYDPVSANASSNLDFTQTIVFKCTKASSGVTVGITNGANYSSGRRLKDATTNFLNYELYQPTAGTPTSCAYTAPYGTTVGTDTYAVGSAAFVTAATSVTVNICGRVPSGQDVPATGNYTDQVTVNVNF